MNTLHTLRRYDPAIDRALREIEAEARTADQEQQRSGEGLVVGIVIGLAIAVAVAMWVLV